MVAVHNPLTATNSESTTETEDRAFDDINAVIFWFLRHNPARAKTVYLPEKSANSRPQYDDLHELHPHRVYATIACAIRDALRVYTGQERRWWERYYYSRHSARDIARDHGLHHSRVYRVLDRMADDFERTCVSRGLLRADRTRR